MENVLKDKPIALSTSYRKPVISQSVQTKTRFKEKYESDNGIKIMETPVFHKREETPSFEVSRMVNQASSSSQENIDSSKFEQPEIRHVEPRRPLNENLEEKIGQITGDDNSQFPPRRTEENTIDPEEKVKLPDFVYNIKKEHNNENNHGKRRHQHHKKGHRHQSHKREHEQEIKKMFSDEFHEMEDEVIDNLMNNIEKQPEDVKVERKTVKNEPTPEISKFTSSYEKNNSQNNYKKEVSFRTVKGTSTSNMQTNTVQEQTHQSYQDQPKQIQHDSNIGNNGNHYTLIDDNAPSAQPRAQSTPKFIEKSSVIESSFSSEIGSPAPEAQSQDQNKQMREYEFKMPEGYIKPKTSGEYVSLITNKYRNQNTR